MAADASDYPTSADSIPRTSPSDNLTGHSDLHDKMADAIEEIQGFVGVSGDTTAGTVVKRITDLEGKDITVTFGTGSDLSGSFTITNLGNVTNTSVAVRDDSHNHVISNVDGLQTALDAKLNSSAYTANDVLTKIKTVDGSTSGLDADLLDGNHASAFSLAHSHPYLSSTGTAVNSDKLDNLDSTQFLRSDADDTASGRITLAKSGMGVDWTTAQLVVNPSPAGDAGIAIRTGNADQYTVQLRAGGSVSSIPRLFVTGDIGGGGSVVWADIECRSVQENSARRFKTNIVPAYSPTSSDAIDKVKQIPLSSFAYLDNPSETVVGVVAEDLVDVLPEAVSYRDGEISSVATQRVTYVALGALKQAINKIEALEARVAELGG